MKVWFMIFSLILILVSCSFKPSENESNSNRISENIESSEIKDTDQDGDGISDALDERPFIADIPLIQGELFKELGIKFIHRNKNESLKILNGHTGMSNYFQFVSELKSSEGDHIRSRISLNDINIFTFTNPLGDTRGIIDEKWSVVENVRVEVSSEFNFKFTTGSYSNVILELYFYNSTIRELELISSVTLTDTFNFNEVTQKTFSFPVSYPDPSRIVNDRGASLFIKVKDFSIFDSRTSFARLQESVLKKTIPLLIWNGSSLRTIYTSSQRKRLTFEEITSTSGLSVGGIKGEVFEVDGLRNVEEISLDFFGNTVKDSKSWSVMTKTIFQDPLSYTYGSGDFLFLTYLSKNNPKTLRPKIFSGIGGARKQLVYSALLKRDGLLRSRIIFRPISFKGQQTNIYNIKNCKWDLCFDFESSYQSGSSLNALGSAFLIEIELNDERFNLGEILQSKKASLKKLDQVDLFEILLSDELKSKFKNENKIKISFNDYKGINCKGTSFCSGVNCASYFNNILPLCTINDFRGAYLVYETSLEKFHADYTGEAYIGFESFD